MSHAGFCLSKSLVFIFDCIHRKLREKWMKADLHIQFYNRHVPSNHTVDHARLLTDMNFRLCHLTRLLLFYGARRWQM